MSVHRHHPKALALIDEIKLRWLLFTVLTVRLNLCSQGLNDQSCKYELQVPSSTDFYLLGKQIFDPPVDAWWVEYEMNKTKYTFFLFFLIEITHLCGYYPKHWKPASKCFSHLKPIKLHTAHLPSNFKLDFLRTKKERVKEPFKMCEHLLWFGGNWLYRGSDRWLSCRLNRFKILTTWTAFHQQECFHRPFIDKGLNT